MEISSESWRLYRHSHDNQMYRALVNKLFDWCNMGETSKTTKVCS